MEDQGMPNQMRPIHPGEILREEMEELRLSARQLAKALGVPTNRVTGLVNETRALTADTALRLARYFGTSPEFWLNLQVAYELRRAQQERGARIAQEVVPRAQAS
jgi:antitoxin HigA-1